MQPRKLTALMVTLEETYIVGTFLTFSLSDSHIPLHISRGSQSNYQEEGNLAGAISLNLDLWTQYSSIYGMVGGTN